MTTELITESRTDVKLTAASATVSIRALDVDRDAARIHEWLTHPRAHYWMMTELDEAEIRAYLEGIRDSADDAGWVGSVDGDDCFYVETYTPDSLIPQNVLATGPGDIGMHLLVAPPAGPAVHGLTDRIMAEVIDFCLKPVDQGGRGAECVVVEPDARNDAIIEKNRAAGFTPITEATIMMGEIEKRALVSVCTRADFEASALTPFVAEAGESDSVQGPTGPRPGRKSATPPAPYAHLNSDAFAVVQRHLVAKALSEFAHERLIHPVSVGASEGAGANGHAHAGGGAASANEEDQTWELSIDGASRYSFTARVLPLEHWVIDEASITRWRDGSEIPLDAQELVVELQDALSIPEDLISTYLEELASTLAGAAFKLEDARAGRRPDAQTLVDADFQTTEAAMTEGHPGFLANNGRIGFGLSDFRTWAPENGELNRIEWVAVRRELSHLSLGSGLDEEGHLGEALSEAERDLFGSRIRAAGQDPADFHLMPIHPWQADHRLAITFAADIARGDLLPLGEGLDKHQAQQSLRTFFNHSRTGAPYVKVALAVQNMGFLRGLSPKYMRDTPAINDWVADLIASDDTFTAAGFRVLRERAALGYTGDVYHRTKETNPHRKMLAALWRENPVEKIAPGQRLITMAALLHRDHQGVSLASELINASGLSAAAWVRSYLRAYLKPLVHALLAHDLVFMPHGENLILVLDEHTVTGAFMKDIGEEVAVLGHRELPADVERIRAVVSGEEKALSVFTDMFDGVLRHLSGILDTDGLLPVDRFWAIVAESLDDYEAEHPESARGVSGDVDLHAEHFAHSCLNRLQLKNTKQMVDIGNQAESLLYAGTMPNPVAG
ncbi:Siderophore synthetase component [Brevibacterium siliguriense]|uniref:Lysine N-acyltransferase MbtK n=1 Tax=Brevibacterium siliguriense TaxID=1136497 RepID=A0A1H1QX92_9MICO|nr:GNAT family N-acetyltransferase [Brevibacterium siliguriense]SDS27915.1 Siderophore synthetase component [Brevibacterium siliguriense]